MNQNINGVSAALILHQFQRDANPFYIDTDKYVHLLPSFVCVVSLWMWRWKRQKYSGREAEGNPWPLLYISLAHTIIKGVSNKQLACSQNCRMSICLATHIHTQGGTKSSQKPFPQSEYHQGNISTVQWWGTNICFQHSILSTSFFENKHTHIRKCKHICAYKQKQWTLFIIHTPLSKLPL